MKSDDEFLEEIKQRLDSSTEELDELTLARLGAARRRAVEAGSRSAVFRLGDTLAIGHTGSLALLLVGTLLILSLVMLDPGDDPVLDNPHVSSLMEDMELLGAAEELEFYQELDFYLWVTDDQDPG
jgi:hypothetical protein